MSAMRYFVSLMVLWSTGVSAEAGGLGKQLVGTWKLVSTEQVLTDGTRHPSSPYDSGGIANLVYTDDGGMCVFFPSPDELSAYCGRYELNEAQRYVVHKIEMKFAPDNAPPRMHEIVEGLSRYFSIDGDTLKLRTVEPRPGVKEDTQTWKRGEWAVGAVL